MIVCKFGGSSVASANQLAKVKSIVESDSRRQVIVVSAPGKRDSSDVKVTDLLYSCCKEVKESGSCDNSFSQIEKRFIEILEDLNLDTAFFKEALKEVKEKINSNAGENYAASRGEYLNAILVAKYFGYEFIDATEIIVINEDGTVDDETWSLIDSKLDKSKKYIIPGFYGRNKNHVVTTFSRGGSDISGAILSKAMNAEVYENWTDVAGCYNADPRFIKSAYPIETMTYKEVRELSALGASVFHADAIAPVMKAGIPINIKNTNDSTAKGTMIVSNKDSNGPIGVSQIGTYTKLSCRKLMLTKAPGMVNTIHSVLRTYGINPMYSVQGVDTFSLLFEKNSISDKNLKLLKERLISEFQFEEITFVSDLSIVGVVGQEINDDLLNYKKSLDALYDNDIKVYQSVVGASSLAFFLVVDEDKAKKSVEVIFKSLF
ncbi:MAG: aspartate kinase [Sphaerochaetaceae bacterium]|nr:aspartate kinase [Sphaerochaetaceae bacterium]MDC7237591.1 aspartate kinase [Sphaerochaetaceae bacterium]MDC7249229.1 aspartate kinase [Sphaerochaetaceae bacterium]